jgi:hypothetical protein
MARARDEFTSLRFGRRESARLVAALLLSLLAHIVIWGGYRIGDKFGVWQRLHVPEWLHLTKKKYALAAQLGHARVPDPTIFVDVSQADSDAPDRSRFYSNKNSRAANPDEANSNVPKITGSQTDMPKTEDVPRPVKKQEATSQNTTPKEASKADKTPQLPKLEPSMPPPTLPPPVPTETPEPPQTPGDLDQRRPQRSTPPSPATTPAPSESQPQTQPQRPRTLRQALAQRDQLPGQKMQQEGGVPNRAMWSSLDVKATAFGDYDRAIIEAVSQRWYDLLDSGRFAQDRSGKVILRFKLMPDGTIIEMQTLENTVGELLGYLCQESIEEAAPFAKWPPDMVRMIGANYREITFTFYYY